MLNVESVEGLNIQRRIKAVVDQGHASTLVYAQKVASHDLQEGEKKRILFNRNMKEYNAEQQEYVQTQLRDFMHTFDYCSPQADESDALYTLTDEWQQEQQVKMNFAKYPKDQFDQARAGAFREMNA